MKKKDWKIIKLDESLELDPEKDYPFRSSLTKVARCGTCKHYREIHDHENGFSFYCNLGFSLKGPYMNHEHDCKEYEYAHDYFMILMNDDFLLLNPGIHGNPGYMMKKLDDCDSCAHYIYSCCFGVRWYPFKKKPKCEFYRDKTLTCKHAVPFLQYGNHLRNNYCKLPPEKRDGDMKRGWKWCCPLAHQKNSLKCHVPIYKKKNKRRSA